MKVTVDRTKCTGLGICESIAPGIFEVSDEGTLNLLQDDISDGDRQDAEKAVATCPTSALRISE